MGLGGQAGALSQLGAFDMGSLQNLLNVRACAAPWEARAGSPPAASLISIAGIALARWHRLTLSHLSRTRASATWRSSWPETRRSAR